ncbi:PAS domain S-box protein [Hydrogenophaga sp.]|uniref:PAS domain-containing sensor histidine kinase n=1 Tax=Hydrogenophaga sp. TaxID=1904254 RepID=UPI00271936D3|nr:PAS domain S-box protein [Hydrogenophaga sp.]MDO8905721.1 PAS domain S-box protein [Hydrogenophaga sp.]
MSALHPPPDSRSSSSAVETKLSVRERAMLMEVEALRAENAYLRGHYAQQLTGTLQDPVDLQAGSSSAPLPLPLEATLSLGDDHAPGIAPLEYRAVFSALSTLFPIGIFRIDHMGVLTHVDDQLKAIFSLEQTDFPHFGWLERVHPEDLDRVRQTWDEGIRLVQERSIEFRIVKPDGSLAHLLANTVPQKDDQHRLTGQLGFMLDISRIRAIEADAQIKDELNHQIIASTIDCTKVLALDGRLQQITAQGCRLMELDNADQVRQGDWTNWWPGEGRQLARAAVESARKGESAKFVAFGYTFKGSPKWWDTVISPIRDAHGTPVMLLAVSRDITESHQQQEEIRRLNEGLETRVRQRTEELDQANQRIRQTLADTQALYDQAPCGYHSVDADGLYVLINQTELDWLDYARHEVVGKRRFRDHVAPEHLDMVKDRLRRLKLREKLETVEIDLLRRDGSRFTVLLSSTAVYDEHGVFVRTNNTLVDVSERNAASRALAEQRNLLQTITDRVPVQIAFFDRDLICRFANASYARWLGNDSQQPVGLHLSQIARPENYESTRDRLAAALAGHSQRFEGEREFPDGNRFYASIEYTPYLNHGEVQGLIIQMLDISDRKASEDQVRGVNARLQEALSQAQSLYNQAPCGYHSLDINGIFVSINDTELEWLGYSREEVVGKLGFKDVIRPENNALLGSRLQRLVDDGVLEAAEYDVQRRDGTVFPALISSSAVRDETGRFLRSNTTVVNISQRKQAELALEHNQRFLQAITDHVPGLIAYVDASLRFRFANAEHLHVYGMDPQQIIGMHMSECVPPDAWQDIAPRIQAAANGSPQRFEAWRTTVSGTPMYISATYLPDMHAGHVQGVFIQIIDITERKRVEERVKGLNEELETRIKERSAELLESEQRFRMMVDNLRDYCIFFMDAQGLITDWTDSAQRLEGYSPSEMLGRHYSVLFDSSSPEIAQSQASQTLRLAASRGQHDISNWHVRKDGSRYWAQSLLIALREANGELRGFAKINRDMSDAKRLDDLMRNINDELENRVTERTEQLLAANRDLESFSYSVSHDLRSPLRHISSFVSLLEEHMGDQRDEVASRYLNTIGNSARHMSQLIDGLLAFSRLGRAAVNVTPVDLAMLVDTVVSQIAHDTEGRVVDWVIPPDLPVVHGDALLLREVWANLLGNAFKYSRPRERAIIEVGWSVDPAVGYTFFVRDNGVGFDPKYAQKLFGVFQRLHRASDFEGTGIGLALARRIVERHGGSIWAESQLGVGSVFYFSLPFESAQIIESPRDSGFAAL